MKTQDKIYSKMLFKSIVKLTPPIIYCIVPKNLTLNTLKQLMGYGRLAEGKVHCEAQRREREAFPQ